MFKKSLVAVAVLGAAAFSAQAADVTLYGLVDLGVNWTQTEDVDGVKADKFGMNSGQNSGSRFGLKGVEDLGNGYKVGFILENQFSADDGTMKDRLFHRESLVYVQSAWGELGFGRTGALDSGTGRYNMMGTGASAIGTGWDLVGDSRVALMGTGDRMDNTVTYQSPNFAGVTVLAQASLKMDNTDDADGQEGSSDANRYYALGVKYNLGALNTGFVASMIDNNRDTFTGVNAKADDAQAYSAYVNYDFGMIKPMLAVQYWDGGKVYGAATWEGAKFGDAIKVANTHGYGVVVGATAPVLGGSFKATAGWNDYEVDGVVEGDKITADGNNLMLGVGYEYSLSKRTVLYTAAGYNEKKLELQGGKDKEKSQEVMFGMIHKF